jgi:hypothetical protein
MKFIRYVALSCCLVAIFAVAQQGTFQHIVIVVQENRTPDNLFASNPTFEAGVNLQSAPDGQAQPLAACFNPDHLHPAWEDQYTKGSCSSGVEGKSCTTIACPQDTYVNAGDVNPYFQIAQDYGFANYFFQTNQGPSFPAHQFLFSGTSAPEPYNPSDPKAYYKWFASEITADTNDAGCAASPDQKILDIDLLGNESFAFDPPGDPSAEVGYPCYEHATLTDLLDQAAPPIHWRYYGWKLAGSIWNAPNAISHICGSTGFGGSCNGTHWQNGDITTTQGQVLTDIQNCGLKAVSWVIPDGNWSDHPGQNSSNLGPIWVSSIVNAIGNSWSSSNHLCDYWGTHTTTDRTAILILWDDWGGWYDHVQPLSIGYLGGGGNGQQYVYGFRVPLLVVSAFTPAGYVSGPVSPGPLPTACPMQNTPYPYCHDFGSVLKFIENNFGLGSIGSSNYPYADQFAPDSPSSLADFFTLQTPRSFQQIILPPGSPDFSYFIQYAGQVEPDDED